MKYFLFIILAISSLAAKAQIKTKSLYGTWVASKINYKDGSDLPDDNPLKYTYVKYIFESPDKLYTTIAYEEKGTERSFALQGNSLILKSPEGYTLNVEQIERLTDTLILVQAGDNGFDDPKSVRYYFVPERNYQDALPLKGDDILSVVNGDTTYIASPKIYANYSGDSFQHEVYEGIGIDMHGRSTYLLASFIVSKQGIADSLKILDSIDNKFDKRFIKVFNQNRKDWKPAIVHGKPVNVQMQVELRYLTSEETIPAYFNSQRANNAYINKQYDIALYFYNEALKTRPSDKEDLYKRGICKMNLGNMNGACEDWNKAKALGYDATINAVLAKYCK